MARDGLPLLEIVEATVARARAEGGWHKPTALCIEDLVVNTGRTWLAARISGNDTVASPMRYVAVGTVATAPSLANTTLAGEIRRKLSAVATNNNGNVWTTTATFGGFADSIQSVAIVEAGVFNHASSGQGTMLQRVTFAAATLANSDILSVTLQINVGSS